METINNMFERRAEGKCPFCGKQSGDTDFKDALSLKEFKISGICQVCQDKTFN